MIETAAKMKIQYDALIYTMAGHGDDGLLRLSDGSKCLITGMISLYNNVNCDYFRDKAKIFILDKGRSDYETLNKMDEEIEDTFSIYNKKQKSISFKKRAVERFKRCKFCKWQTCK